MRAFSNTSKIKIALGAGLIIFGIAFIVVIAVGLSRNPCNVTSTNARINDIQFVDFGDVIRVTWRRPEVFTNCNPEYQVQYSSALGETSFTTTTETMLISNAEFCMRLVVGIRASVRSGPTFTTAAFDDGTFNVNMTTPRTDPDTLIVTWSYRNQERCHLDYNVFYAHGTVQSITVSVREARFRFAYCTRATLSFIPLAGNGFFLPAIIVDGTHSPEEERIDRVRFLNTTSYDEVLLLSWLPIEPMGVCEVSYNLLVTTDLTKFSQIIENPAFNFTRDIFCFSVQYQLRVIMGTSIGPSVNTSMLYGISPVQDIELTRSMADNTLIATWPENWLQDQCSLQYLVTYEHGSILKTSTTNQPNVTFDMAYCANTTVNVRVLHNGRQSETSNATHEEEFPTWVEQAEDISVIRDEASALVSWYADPSLSECDDIYEVAAKHESGQMNSCQGATSCEIFLDDFCPSTNFTISPTAEPEKLYTWKYECA